MTEQILEKDLDGVGQPRDVADSGFFERGQGTEIEAAIADAQNGARRKTVF
jgi:hypothetical protein